MTANHFGISLEPTPAQDAIVSPFVSHSNASRPPPCSLSARTRFSCTCRALDTSLTHDLSPIDRDNDRVSVNQDELHRVVRLWQEQAGKEASQPYESLFKYVHPLVSSALSTAPALCPPAYAWKFSLTISQTE